MKKLLGYLPFHFLLFLILGICCQFFADGLGFEIVTILCIFFSLCILSYFIRKKSLFIFMSWFAFFLLGMLVVYQGDETKNENYYERFLTDSNTSIVKIIKVLKPGNYNYKYKATVIQVNDCKTIGSVLLNVQKDSFISTLKVDDEILFKEEFIEINTSLNPHQFDYQSYLAKQGIHRQVFIKYHEFLMLNSKSESLLGIIYTIRTEIQKSLHTYHFSDDELAVMNALLLGQRQDISKELIDEYSKAGAIHILAVSGLHVGVILLILSSLFKPLERIRKGKFLKLIIILVFLWFFALLAGMSASVVRAVTMFTAVAIGQFLNKRNAIEHSLIFSMFILLLCKPLFLFEVGFQLSYLAVFGIIWIQPVIYNRWKPRFLLLDKAWQLITVSIAAQLGVLPLSLFYFHQFPGLFLVSNLVIIPFLGCILIGGILILTLASLSILPEFLADFYGFIISLLNSFIAFIAKQEEFLLSSISFSGLKMIASYLLIISGFQFFIKRNSKRLLVCLGSIFLFQVIMIYEKFTNEIQQEFVVFHKSRNSILGQRIGAELFVYYDMDSLEIAKQNLLKNYKVGENVQYRYSHQLPNLFNQKQQPILLIDSLGIYNLKGLTNPIIILQQSPKINLERLIKTLNPKQIIADGSNYKSSVLLWQQTCFKTKTPFWSTYQNGAYIVR